MYSPKLLCLAVAVAATACRQPVPTEYARARALEDQVQFLSEEFIHTSLALHPSAATAQGYHVDHGVQLDEELDDYSPPTLDRARRFYRLSLQRASHLSMEPLPPEFQADLNVVKRQSRSGLLDLDRLQRYRHNPTLYVEICGNALYSPFILDYAPEPKRLAQIIARLQKIPAFLQTAQQNLQDSPEVWTRVAESENLGNIDLIDQAIRRKVPADLKARYNAAAANALAALRSFNTFLQNVLSSHTREWRLDPQLYAEKFNLSLATSNTPQQVLAEAESQLQIVRQDMRKQALALYPKFYPGKTPPQDLKTLVSQVLNQIAQQHARPSQYFPDAVRDLAETTQFVKDHQLVAIPETSNIDVVPTPPFLRGLYSVGGFAPAPALEPQLGSFFWITPFTRDMSPSRIESKLREYNVYALKILTVHEAMPGHSVQFEYADRIQPLWRRALRAVYPNPPYVEGWSVYATQLMIDAGYQDTPEMRLTFAKQMLRVVANTILDIKLHTLGMTDTQAMDLLLNQTFQEKEEADQKLQRAKLSSVQLATYFVGWRGWESLADAYKKKQGSGFRIADFNARALREGAIPLPELSDLLLQGDAAQ